MEKPIYCYRIWDENKRKWYSTKTNRSIWMNAQSLLTVYKQIPEAYQENLRMIKFELKEIESE